MEKQNIEFPNEFKTFANNFNGLPVDYNNPKIEYEYDGIDYESGKSIYGRDLDRLKEKTIVTFGDAANCEVSIEYVSNYDYELLKRFIDSNEEYKRAINPYQEYWKEWGKNREDDEEIKYITANIRELKNQAQVWYNSKVPNEFIGHVVTKDLVITLKDDLIEAAIKPENDNSIFLLYGKRDDKGCLNDVSLSSYNLYDYASYMYEGDDIPYREYNRIPYFDEFTIDYNNVYERIQKIKSQGIEPEAELEMNFKNFLEENGLADKYQEPILGLYLAKNSIVEKLNTLKNKKTLIS